MPKTKRKLKRQFAPVASISPRVQVVLEKLRKGEELTVEEDEMSLFSAEVAAVLTQIKGEEVSTRYLPQMIRDGRLQPIGPAPTGTGYLYKMGQVRRIEFKKPGRPPEKVSNNATTSP